MKSSRAAISLLNSGYVEELYERYLRRPESVDDATRSFFEKERGRELPAREQVSVARLVEAIRVFGHRSAHLDPVADPPAPGRELALATYGLSDADLEIMPSRVVGGPVSEDVDSAKEAIDALRAVYCSTLGYDYGHVHDPDEREWLTRAAESGHHRPPRDPIDAVELLKALSRVEAFETFLHRTMPGRFRFSIEGLDVLVPLLEELLGEAAERGVRRMVMGMAHRGRLNVLAHVLGKPYETIFEELRDPMKPTSVSAESGFQGDVTYHMGARRAKKTGTSIALVVNLLPNPSHVEAINPVVEGMARAAGTLVDRGGPPRVDPTRTLPVLVHGDAAFPGQGVVAETLNLANLPAYTTGGTIHVIANNVLGFTTEPRDLYSTRYASDLAKGFDVPVIHVNADDPEAVIEAARTAVAYLSRFRKDFMIDLIGYRRRGHNESDEPRFTQPVRYSRIDALPTVRQKWAETLAERGALEQDRAREILERAHAALRSAWKAAKEREAAAVTEEKPRLERSPEPPPPTAVELERLRGLNAALLEPPETFRFHPKLRSAREARRHVLDEPDEPTIDWATAEELAFATLLSEGTSIRLTGEDTERGTFSQRHAVFHDAETGARYVPLQSIRQARAAFEVANSPLSENAALGFEVGYDLETPDRLVVWEAQYGDFINGAQVVVDEFLVAARAKWGLSPKLVLLLPHGHEGHGPDHSTGRIERFLSLAANDNLRAANVTTSAQYFHLLRRQASLLLDEPRPLVVFTPKALLREPLAKSKPRELAEGGFRPVLDDPRYAGDRARAGNVRRLLLVSGKIYVDLVKAAAEAEVPPPPLCRLEQLYPFPEAELRELLSRYEGVEELVWVQEEPRNMGVWPFASLRLRALLPERIALDYVGREASPTPAEGTAAAHEARQRIIVERALGTAPVRASARARKEA